MREESEAVNESFWDAPGAEIEAFSGFMVWGAEHIRPVPKMTSAMAF